MGGTSRILAFQHDKEGNRTRITHPDNWFFQYGFDGLNRVSALGESASATPTAGTNSLLTITYRPSGGRLDLIRANGTVTNLDPDNALRLESFTQNFSGTANDLTNLFFYNPASQVTKLSQSNCALHLQPTCEPHGHLSVKRSESDLEHRRADALVRLGRESH